MKDRFITPSYYFILTANPLLYFGFWLLIPVLPFYPSEILSTSNFAVDIILSRYTVAALYIRPFPGYSPDSSARKPLYLLAYFIFMAIFAGCIIVDSPALSILSHIMHGISFDMVTVGGNTIVIGIMSSSRHGEGLGYYGLSDNIVVAVELMSSLFPHDAGMSYTSTSCYSLGSYVVGLICVSLVKTPYKPSIRCGLISLDRFILLKDIPTGISLFLLSIPYGTTTNYVAMYARGIGVSATTDLFLTFIVVDMTISRIFSGKTVDRGKITRTISTEPYIAVFSFFLFSSCAYIISWSGMTCSIIFFTVALPLRIGFDIMFPTYNTLFVSLVPNNQRGTITSTYLTSWDVSIGIGMLTGGYIAEVSTFDKAYLFGACLMIISMLYFNSKAAPHYHKDKLR